MYRKISDFITDWQTEKELTLKIFKALTAESLGIKSYPEGRSLGRIAWHITASVSETGKTAGIEITDIDEALPYPSDPAELYSLYEKTSGELETGISGWLDEKLNEEILAYGNKWSRSFTLRVLIRHQIHHRAQMTVLMRLAGLRVPGIYGPSREEWVEFNMVPIE